MNDWERFMYYALRIRNLTLKDCGRNQDHVWPPPTTLEALSQYRMSATLLPSLRKLHLIDLSEQHAGILNTILTQGLREIYIESRYADLSLGTMSNLLGDIARMAHDLTSLTINITKHDSRPPMTPFLLANLRELQNVVVHLPCDRLAANAMVAWLSSLPKLTTLCLGDVSLPVHIISEAFGTVVGFTQLRTLGIATDALPKATAILNGLNDSSLVHLTAVSEFGDTYATANDVEAFMKAAAFACSPSIQLLNVRCPSLPSEPADRTPLPFEVMKPLLAFQHLEHLSLHFEVPIKVGDEKLEEYAKAWPRLQSLKLRLSPFRGHGFLLPSPEGEMTLRCLISFARYCRYLQSLHIKLDARVFTTIPSERPGAGHSCNNLRKLDLDYSNIDDPVAVAAFLSDIFPELRKVETEARSFYKVKWDEVSRLLQILGPVRAQERRWLSRAIFMRT
ncbi:hypothetical protein CERSUDRAFT_94535 [Gelatoporia subvermispora B]|uniref:F-box domain-containing protein n=1 Tax=Ceriporiopsis subvermispora (strain B) TaxID=914234 RepID=M2RGE5_CERS8|nr:hypothetical protein CERSUDRAFT_94535 [Gelatoporia subvermispora B]